MYVVANPVRGLLDRKTSEEHLQSSKESMETKQNGNETKQNKTTKKMNKNTKHMPEEDRRRALDRETDRHRDAVA